MGSEAHSERCPIINKTNNMSNGNLTPQQENFVNNLVQGMSIIDAYKKAGYKGNGGSSYASASRLVRNVKIKDEIKARLWDGSIQVKALTPKAIETVLFILDLSVYDVDGKLNLGALRLKWEVVKDVFDRSGLKPELVARLVGDEKQPIRVLFEGLDE